MAVTIEHTNVTSAQYGVRDPQQRLPDKQRNVRLAPPVQVHSHAAGEPAKESR